MADIGRARRMIEQAAPAGPSSFEQFTRGSLVAAFNRLAPVNEQLGLRFPESTLQIRLDRPVDARDTTGLLDHLSRAVAAIGREVVGQQGKSTRLTPRDYERAAIFPEFGGGDFISVRPEGRPRTQSAFDTARSTTDIALDRLVNLLPGTDEGGVDVHDYVAAQQMSRIALNEIAAAVSSVGNLYFKLNSRDRADTVEAQVTTPTATRMLEVLSVPVRDRQVVQVEGTLDGARVSRRRFYLELPGSTPDLEGIFDEELVGEVVNQLRRPVIATLERTTLTTSAGRRDRPRYRLIKLDLPDSLFDTSQRR